MRSSCITIAIAHMGQRAFGQSRLYSMALAVGL